MTTYWYKEIHAKRVAKLSSMQNTVSGKRIEASQKARWSDVKNLRLLEVRIQTALNKACVKIEQN